MGSKRSEESKKAQSERMKADYASGKRIHPMQGKKFSDESRLKMKLSHLGKPSPSNGKKKPVTVCGENHWNWKGGKSSYKHFLRNSLDWKLWREFIFRRDKYVCQECGAVGVYIEPHHILPIRSIQNNIFDTRNGITLCRPCHRKTVWKESNYQEKYLKIVAAHS